MVTIMAGALSDEFPSAFIISEDDALGVAQGMLKCSPAIGEFWRSGLIEGIDLARELGAEPDDTVEQCALSLFDDELLGNFLAAVLRGDAGRADVALFVQTTTELLSEACA